MICPNCGLPHENEKGHCPNPNCSPKTSLVKRQRERPHSSDVGQFPNVPGICPHCGQTVLGTSVRVSPHYEQKHRLEGFEYFFPNKRHSCAQKI